MARMLAYFAHPDDETFGVGGTLALYAAAGHEIRVVCATAGDSGLNRVDADDTERLDEIRTEELRAACRQLGILEPIVLDYRDSGMAGTPENDHPESLHQADLDEVATRFREILDAEQPDLVITFEASGWYGHPDHIKVYQAVRRMYEGLEEGSAPPLYFACFAADAMRYTVKLMEEAGEDIPESFRDGSRFRYPVAAIPIVIDTTPVADKKIAAFNEHLTQIGPGGASARFTKEILEVRTAREFFLPAAHHDALPEVLPFERSGGLFGEPAPDPLVPYPLVEDETAG
jgi:N-acetyl-1-D-myo-inositol-2-amino-2-deoxy-alpha-D-glucopyranoside deacetylase